MDITAALQSTAIKYRKELLLIPHMGLKEHVLQYMTFFPNIQWKEVIGQLSGKYHLRPYDGEINEQGPLKVESRALEVFIGDCITYEKVEDLRKSILGEGLIDRETFAKFPIELQILSVIMNSFSQNLNACVWNAVRNDSGAQTKDLFNGFDTIHALDVAAGNISAAKKNLVALGAITSANGMDKCRELYLGADKNLRLVKTFMFVPFGVYDDAQQQMIDDGFSTQSGGDKDQFLYVLGSNKMCQIVPQVGKSMSPYLTLTTKKNMQIGTNVATDSASIKVRESENPHKTQFATKMGFGVQTASIKAQDFCIGTITPES